ncbi:MAG: RimK family alpha-L-glutamate ligase [Bacteroidales bacterium]|nr:RimK family alpha-L-glutamate ligase [Bacteroidales bacterium]
MSLTEEELRVARSEAENERRKRHIYLIAVEEERRLRLEKQKEEKEKGKKCLNITILSAAPGSEATQSIIKAGEKRGHKMTVLDPAKLYLYISDKENGYDRIYDGSTGTDKPERIKAKEIDAVISRIGANLEYGATVLEHFNRNLNIFCTQSANGIKTASNKLISLQRLSQAGIRTPQTVIGNNIIHCSWLIDKIGGLPAIAKTLQGSQGIGVVPLKDPEQTNAMLQSFHKSKVNLLLQQYIEAGARDIRVIVIDSKVIAAMERTAVKGSLRANISQGGSGRKIELSQDDQDICINAARAVGLAGACGVDLIKDKDGSSYIIEVNSNYGYHVETITGVDISTPLIQYVEHNWKRGGLATEGIASAMTDPMIDYFLSLSMMAGIRVAENLEREELNELKNSILSSIESYNIDPETFEKDLRECYFQ